MTTPNMMPVRRDIRFALLPPNARATGTCRAYRSRTS